jgi:ATP-binding cassette, subfamily B, bacterial CvaB/MchF/RaxB
LAIVGPSGCGKSTLLKVLLGLLPASAGEVLINGLPLQRLGAAAWRAQVGTVMQDDQLFAGSIAANISFFAAEPDLAWVQACAQRAGLHDDIMAMPMDYQSLIGDMGSALSGGQRQRLLLARALYKRPSVLVLDEATSALDEASERAVTEAVRQLALTRIIVAHRPQTVAAADRVVRMQQGQVHEDSSG